MSSAAFFGKLRIFDSMAKTRAHFVAHKKLACSESWLSIMTHAAAVDCLEPVTMNPLPMKQDNKLKLEENVKAIEKEFTS